MYQLVTTCLVWTILEINHSLKHVITNTNLSSIKINWLNIRNSENIGHIVLGTVQ